MCALSARAQSAVENTSLEPETKMPINPTPDSSTSPSMDSSTEGSMNGSSDAQSVIIDAGKEYLQNVEKKLFI